MLNVARLWFLRRVKPIVSLDRAGIPCELTEARDTEELTDNAIFIEKDVRGGNYFPQNRAGT